MIDLGRITQGERGTLLINWEFPVASPSSLVGAAITAVAQNLDTGDVTSITGTLTPTGAATATWALSEGDSSTPGTYAIIFRAVVAGVQTYTLAASLVVEANPAVTAVQNPPVTAVPEPTSDGLFARLRASGVGSWLAATSVGAALFAAVDAAAARGAIGAMPVVSPATAGNLVTLAAGGTLVDAGFAADTAATPGSVVRRGAGGRVELQPSENDIGLRIFAAEDGSVALRAVGTVEHASIGVSGDVVNAVTSGDGVTRWQGDDAAANRALARTELGLGSAALLTSGATGASLVAAETQDAARAVVGLAAVAMPPRILDHTNLTYSSINVAGSGNSLATYGSAIRLTTEATANSSIRRTPDVVRIGYVSGFTNWSVRNVFGLGIVAETANVQGVSYVFYGKLGALGLGAPASGDYVGLKIENTTVTALYVCASGALATIAVSQSISAATFAIVCQNGAVNFFRNGLLIGASVAGPTNANSSGSISFEIANGATAAAYGITFMSASEVGA